MVYVKCKAKFENCINFYMSRDRSVCKVTGYGCRLETEEGYAFLSSPPRTNWLQSSGYRGLSSAAKRSEREAENLPTFSAEFMSGTK
jgi:hypothetical protein